MCVEEGAAEDDVVLLILDDGPEAVRAAGRRLERNVLLAWYANPEVPQLNGPQGG